MSTFGQQSSFSVAAPENRGIECAICLMPWWDPRELLPCRHVFCAACIPPALSTCPQCRGRITQLVEPNRILVNLAKEARVTCDGCEWVGTLESSRRHTCTTAAAEANGSVPPEVSAVSARSPSEVAATAVAERHTAATLSPSTSARVDAGRVTGTVVKWLDERGFGFILRHGGSPEWWSERHFVHHSAYRPTWVGAPHRLELGLRVEYDIVQEGNRTRAANVTALPTSAGFEPIAAPDVEAEAVQDAPAPSTAAAASAALIAPSASATAAASPSGAEAVQDAPAPSTAAAASASPIAVSAPCAAAASSTQFGAPAPSNAAAVPALSTTRPSSLGAGSTTFFSGRRVIRVVRRKTDSATTPPRDRTSFSGIFGDSRPTAFGDSRPAAFGSGAATFVTASAFDYGSAPSAVGSSPPAPRPFGTTTESVPPVVASADDASSGAPRASTSGNTFAAASATPAASNPFTRVAAPAAATGSNPFAAKKARLAGGDPFASAVVGVSPGGYNPFTGAVAPAAAARDKNPFAAPRAQPAGGNPFTAAAAAMIASVNAATGANAFAIAAAAQAPSTTNLFTGVVAPAAAVGSNPLVTEGRQQPGCKPAATVEPAVRNPFAAAAAPPARFLSLTAMEDSDLLFASRARYNSFTGAVAPPATKAQPAGGNPFTAAAAVIIASADATNDGRRAPVGGEAATVQPAVRNPFAAAAASPAGSNPFAVPRAQPAGSNPLTAAAATIIASADATNDRQRAPVGGNAFAVAAAAEAPSTSNSFTKAVAAYRHPLMVATGQQKRAGGNPFAAASVQPAVRNPFAAAAAAISTSADPANGANAAPVSGNVFTNGAAERASAASNPFTRMAATAAATGGNPFAAIKRQPECGNPFASAIVGVSPAGYNPFTNAVASAAAAGSNPFAAAKAQPAGGNPFAAAAAANPFAVAAAAEAPSTNNPFTRVVAPAPAADRNLSASAIDAAAPSPGHRADTAGAAPPRADAADSSKDCGTLDGKKRKLLRYGRSPY